MWKIVPNAKVLKNKLNFCIHLKSTCTQKYRNVLNTVTIFRIMQFCRFKSILFHFKSAFQILIITIDNFCKLKLNFCSFEQGKLFLKM